MASSQATHATADTYARQSSRLDPEESPVHAGPDLYRSFRHSAFGGMRAAVFAILRQRQPQHPSTNAYARCGADAWLQRTPDDPPAYRIAASACKHRFCPACQQQRGRRIVANLKEQAPSGTYRFITLTQKSTDDGLGACVDRLYRNFRNFRRSPEWKAHVTGGIAFFEVTLNPETRRWHPHFHILCQGEFWDIKDLRTAWFKQTGDSHICDIQLIHGFDDVTHYLVKYASKGFDPTIWRSRPALEEAIDAMAHTKLIVTFGSFRKLRLLGSPKSDANWLPVRTASSLIRAALAGDSVSECICRRLWGTRWSIWKGKVYPCPNTS